MFLYFAGVVLILAGCAPQIKQPTQICPGKKTPTELLSLLRQRWENTVPLKANGQCRLQYYAEGEPKKENFPVQLWVNPPAEIYLQGDVALNPKGIVLCSNEQEFWLAMKPKEISSFWWGKWSQQRSSEGLMISPRLVLEALGFVEMGDMENWYLSNEGAFDILTKQNSDGTIAKKIYVHSNRDYLVRKIAYLNKNGKAWAVTELDKYKKVSEGFFAPSVIKIVTFGQNSDEPVSINFNLKSIKPREFSDKKRKAFFYSSKPKAGRFKHVFRIVDGEIIEQQQ